MKQQKHSLKDKHNKKGHMGRLQLLQTIKLLLQFIF